MRKQIKETVAEEMPRVAPAPLAPEPVVQVPAPEPEKQHAEKAHEEPQREQNSQQAFAAPVTTAPPPGEAKPADTAAAPAPGMSIIAARAQASWQRSLVAHINRYKRYPAEARAHKLTGIVTVEFTLDRRGQILSSRIAHSSGSAVLDEEAVALLMRAAPLPTPGEDVPSDGLHLALPIHFRID
jgi:protein TonB